MLIIIMRNYRKKTDISSVLRFFPNIELSYEKTIHKKVQADLYLVIPKGGKCFIWYKLFNNKPTCFLLNLNVKSKKITSIRIIKNIFNDELCTKTGTIIYGTNFRIGYSSCFTIENIFFYKGNDLKNYNQHRKFSLINRMFKNDISQKKIFQKQITIGLPIMSNNIDDIYKKITNVTYNIYSIQHRLLFKNKTFLNLPYKNNATIYKTFLIKPSIVNDIYDLFACDDEDNVKVGNAYIPSYKTSVFMNSIFRNIKENDNLDALEESDDEDEFENINADKFVDLEKSEIFKCYYDRKFKSWVPVEISKEKISSKKEIFLIEKKNNY